MSLWLDFWCWLARRCPRRVAPYVFGIAVFRWPRKVK